MTASLTAVASPNLTGLGGRFAAFDSSSAFGGFTRLSAGLRRPSLFAGRPAGSSKVIALAPPQLAPRSTGRGAPVAPSRSRRFEHPVRRDVPVARPIRPAAPRPSVRPTPVRPAVTTRPDRRQPAAVARSVSHPRAVGSLRLTRRGRIVGLLIIAAVAYGAFGLGRASAVSDAPVSRPQEVVVKSGDSLWTIAVRSMPNQDPRDAVAKLKSLNHLSGAQVEVGERLKVG